jgi:regulatory protein
VAGKSSSRRGPRRPAGPALETGLRLLARRAHSRAELRQKLARRGYLEDEVGSALARLTEMNYLDDAAFARGLVRRRSGTRGYRALSAELAAKGISREEIAASLSTLEAADELAAATRIAERLYAEKPSPGYRETLERIGARLARRGFPGDVVRAACRAVLAGTSDA